MTSVASDVESMPAVHVTRHACVASDPHVLQCQNKAGSCDENAACTAAADIILDVFDMIAAQLFPWRSGAICGEISGVHVGAGLMPQMVSANASSSLRYVSGGTALVSIKRGLMQPHRSRCHHFQSFADFRFPSTLVVPAYFCTLCDGDATIERTRSVEGHTTYQRGEAHLHELVASSSTTAKYILLSKTLT